ncbi:T9SS type A sorting domain-containing protein [Hymenobacter guriensis]|uniref:T9SS type A sorting domain-containing protein n=1 Tax=Hymenobacter guriensis TaxID=2793065 RepID=A0ABS0L8V1_9BACT|nr:T9SS type A sorting domain-containing protein [Hymenobacter guriensis]MBG8555869.1 T9SS type A sorting domain-containing protein [Hymenobacter guriensis]
MQTAQPTNRWGRAGWGRWMMTLGLLLSSFLPVRLLAQNITQAEYYLDGGPGNGTATAVPIAAPAPNLSNLAFSLNLSSLSAGFHSLAVRTKDANAHWSLVTSRSFYYEPLAATAANLSRIEYFVDTDPGFGSATNVPFTAGATASGVTFAVNLSSLSAGFHSLGIRSKDANGKWSLTQQRTFYYEPTASATLANITRVEYFVDTDPGFGSATSVPFTAASNVSGITFSVNLSSLSPGFHSLNIRTRDASGKWSLVTSRTFYYETQAATAPNITKVEYFLDADPGFGSGTNVPITAGTNVSNISLNVALGSLSAGFHTLSVRAKDANSKWSLTTARTFYYEPVLAVAPNINRVEYYFDTDPGFGSGTNVPITASANLSNLAFAADASALADGTHRLFIRSRDANGKWSLVTNRSFLKNGCASSPNFAAGQPAGNYNYGGSTNGLAETAFNTDPASPNTSNTFYGYNGSLLQADLGSAQTVSEVRYKLTPSNSSNFTLLVQTAPSLGGTYTTVDTYTASFVVNTTTLVTRTLATPVSARVLRLVVQNANGQYAVISGVGGYYFNCAGPTIVSFTPPGGAGGTSVEITGTNLTGATALKFNGVDAQSFTVNSATSITAVAPAGGSTGQICVTTPNGTACSAASYTYPPTIVTGTVSPSSFCSTTYISVPFTTNMASYTAGNQFHFQLSDASGNFTDGSRLYGYLSSQNANGGVLTDSIAFRTPAGTGYRVRVVASNPEITGTSNSQNLTVRALPLATAGAAQTTVAYNGTIQLTAGPTGQSSYQWYVRYANGGGTGYVGSGQTLNIANAQPSQSGLYFVHVQNSGGCQDSASVRVTVQPSAQPILSMAQFGYSGCAGQQFSFGFTVQGNNFQPGNVITAQLSNASGSFTTPTSIGTANFEGQGNGSISVTIPAGAATGTGYRIRLVSSSPGVTSQNDNGSNISLTTQPTAVPSSNSPVAYGGTIQLTAQSVPGASYIWTGPNFYSTQQNPTITGASQGANQGTYTLYVTVGGCQSVGVATQVTVNPSTDPILTMTSQPSGAFCGNNGINLSFSVTGNSFAAGNTITAQLSNASGSFAAPTNLGSVAFVGQGNGSFAISLPANTPAGTGYRLRLMGSNPAVTSINDNGTNLTINPAPAAVASSNSPVADNGIIQLTAQTVAGATYAWSGPNGFSSTQQNPTINFAGQANAGTYTLTVTLGTCAAKTNTTVTVQPGAPTLTLNSSTARQICAGNSVNLSFTVGGSGLASGGSVTAQLSNSSGAFTSPTTIGSVSFTGAGSSSVSVTVPAATTAGTGYRVRLVSTNPALTSTESGLWSITNLTSVTASSNSPVTAGGTIQLTSGGVPNGASVQWTGPNGFNSTDANPTINFAGSANVGTYTLTVGQNNCSVERQVAVSVSNPVASVTTGSVSGGFCPGSGLSVSFTSSGTFASGNQFRAVLSNSSGSFAAGTQVIGTLSQSGAVTSGTIAATIPGSAAAGSSYRIRVEATNPSVTSTNDNGSNLTVQAVSYTWTGGYNTDWFDTRNWSCGQIPTSTSIVTIGIGTYYPVIVGSGAVVRNITVVSGASFRVSSSFTIYGNVVNNGTWTSGGSYVFAGSGTQTVGGSSAVYFGGVTINSGVSLSLGTGIYVAGNWVNNGGFVGGTYFVNFNGTVGQIIGGSVVTNFYHVVVSNTVGLTLNQNIYVLGNWTNNGVFVAGTYGTTFGGSVVQVIGGTSLTNFYGLTILNNVGVTLNAGIGLGGPFVNNGVFTVNTQTVVFNGTVLQTIGGTTETTFYDVIINNTVGVKLVSSILVLGDWINNGQFLANSYSVIFGGTLAQIIGGTQVTNFYDVTFQNPVSVTLHQNIYVLGGFVNTGVFYGYYTAGGVTSGYWVRFGGTVAQVIDVNSTTYFWHFYADNAAGISLASHIYVAGNFYLYSGTFAPGAYTVYFNGTGGVVQTVGGYTGLSFYGWNIVSGASVRLLQNVTLLGGFVNAGTFYGYNLVGGVYTGYTFVFGGSAAQILSGAGTYNFWHVTWNNAISVTLQQNIYVLGNWVNTRGFGHGGYTVYFNGTTAQTIGGAVNTTFHHISIGNLVSVTLNQQIAVLGNWLGTGKFLAGLYAVYFQGTTAQTILTGSATRFYHLYFDNPTSVTLLSNIYLNGNWVHNGGFAAGTYGVFFTGTTLQTIGGTALTRFHHISIGTGANVRLDRAVTVLGNWTTNGTFGANGYVVTFGGTVNQLIGGSVVVPFYGVIIDNTTAGVTLGNDIRIVGGNWVNNGVFSPATYRVIFEGTVAQLIGGTATSTFHGLTILNNVGVSLTGPIFIKGNLVNDGVFSCAGYLVTFNGSAAQSIGGTAVTVFGHLTFNNAVGVSLLQDIRVRGDLRNLAVFAAGARTVYFDGTAAQAIYCPSGTLTFHHVVFSNALGVTLQDNIFLTGNWLNNGGFAHGGKLVTFKGSVLQTIGGTVNTVFHHLTLASGANVRLDRAITLLGNWLNNGATFAANAFTVFFNGTALQSIGGTAISVFHHLTLNNTVGVNLDFDIDLTGNFVNNGKFCGCGHRTRFLGTLAQTITCTSGQTRFHDVTFANVAGVTLLDNIGVTGNWVNNGGFVANGYLVLFSGTALQTIGGTVLSAFHHVQITNAVNVQLLRDITVGGYWLNSGIFSGNGFGVTFNGTTQQTITTTGASAKTTFHHVTWANLVGCLLGGDIYVAGNWLCNGPFNPATYTVYFTGTTAQTMGGSATLRFHGLNVQNTVGLTCNGPVYLYGNLTNGGLVNVGTYPWYCVGTSAQTLGGTTTTPIRFYDLHVQNGSGVGCTSNLGVTHMLTLTTGNLASDGHLTLHSNASGTAMVVNPAGGGTVTGRATMERFITGLGAPGYRHYSSPMQLGTATVQEFADDLPVFELNPAYNTRGNTVTPFPTLFRYEETRLTAEKNTFTQGWMVPSANENLVPGRGYSAQTLPSTVVDISGVLSNGNVSYSMTRGAQLGAGWNLAGNPYPAPMDWDVVRKTGGMLSGVDDALYVFVPSGKYTGAYCGYVNGVGQNGGNKDVAAMQGFLVRASSASGRMNLTNAVRHTSYTSPAYQRGTQEKRPVVRLEARSAQGLADEAVFYLQEGAGEGYQANFDAYKVTQNGAGRPTIWSQAGADALSINGLPALPGQAIPLGVRVSEAGRHTLVLTSQLNLPAGTRVLLEDRLLNRKQDLSLDSVYAFTLHPDSVRQRFYLWLGAGSVTATAPAALQAGTALYPNPTTTGFATLEVHGLKEQGPVTGSIYNSIGQRVQQLTLRPHQGVVRQQLDLRTLPTGVYTVHLQAAEGTVVKRLVRE